MTVLAKREYLCNNAVIKAAPLMDENNADRIRFMEKTLKICSRGHEFYKSSDCPVCPKSWSGYYKEKAQSDFPHLVVPALRALQNANIHKLSDLASFQRKEIADLHGIGSNALHSLEEALTEKNLSFKNS